MSRLRIRVELNRGGAGVPLHKLASVVDQTQKFFRMLGEDVHIAANSGVWVGSDFDNKSLNFTAEYVGPVEPEQIRQFYAAFDGVTQMRRSTIAQFARIADGIGEDELIGFGLYQNDQENEPGEWRSLSKREALRITEEIRLLLDRTEGGDGESRMPAALDPTAAATLFRERREHGGLAERVARLETEVSRHGDEIQGLRGTTANTERNLQNLLVAVDAFCDRATRQMEKLPPALEATNPPSEPSPIAWRIPAAVLALAVLGGLGLYYGTQEPRTSAAHVQAADPIRQAKSAEPPPQPAPVVSVTPASKPVPKPPPVRTATGASLKIELKASQATWVGVYEDEKLTFAKVLEPGQTRSLDTTGRVRVQLGNAGGVELAVNGRPAGPLGAIGQVRTVEVTADGFHPIAPERPKPDRPQADGGPAPNP